MSRFIPTGMGWLPGYSDPRDYSPQQPEVRRLLGAPPIGYAAPGKSADLREYFPEVEDQGTLNSSCAFAVLGLVEYFQARCVEPPLEASRLFLYQTALRLNGTGDDLGTDLRSTLKALRRFGTPPQRFWPYQSDRFQQAPSDPFLFGFSREYRDFAYFRLDAGHSSDVEFEDRLSTLKRFLSAGIPFLLGFHVPSVLSGDGLIGDCNRTKTVRGGQAVIVVGFDDDVRIGSNKGAFLIRNSWGRQWGDQGYGWLPYDVLTAPTSNETWSIAGPAWSEAIAEW